MNPTSNDSCTVPDDPPTEQTAVASAVTLHTVFAGPTIDTTLQPFDPLILTVAPDCTTAVTVLLAVAGLAEGVGMGVGVGVGVGVATERCAGPNIGGASDVGGVVGAVGCGEAALCEGSPWGGSVDPVEGRDGASEDPAAGTVGLCETGAGVAPDVCPGVDHALAPVDPTTGGSPAGTRPGTPEVATMSTGLADTT